MGGPMNAIEFLLGTNTRPLKSGLNEAKSQVSEFKASVGKQLAGLFSFGIFVSQLKSVSEEFDRVQKLGQMFGESAETIQRVGMAASLAGADMEQVGTAMMKATKNAMDAANGSETLARDFKRLGINAAEFVNLPLEDKLTQVSAGLVNIEGDGERGTIAINLLGRAGKEMLPLLLQGPDALTESMKLAVVATQAQIDKMAELNDELEVVNRNVKTTFGQWAVESATFTQDTGSMLGGLLAVAKGKFSAVGLAFSQMVKGDIKGSLETVFSQGSFAQDLLTAARIAAPEVEARTQASKERTEIRRRVTKPLAEETGEIGASKKAIGEIDKNIAAEIARMDDDSNKRAELSQKQISKDAEESNRAKIKAAQDAGRIEEDKMQFILDMKQRSLGFASGISADGGFGQHLAGVNYAVINQEAEKGIRLQQEMANHLKEIAMKSWKVEVPEAS